MDEHSSRKLCSNFCWNTVVTLRFPGVTKLQYSISRTHSIYFMAGVTNKLPMVLWACKHLFFSFLFLSFFPSPCLSFFLPQDMAYMLFPSSPFLRSLCHSLALTTWPLWAGTRVCPLPSHIQGHAMFV